MTLAKFKREVRAVVLGFEGYPPTERAAIINRMADEYRRDEVIPRRTYNAALAWAEREYWK